jgi:hypothetical protein
LACVTRSSDVPDDAAMFVPVTLTLPDTGTGPEAPDTRTSRFFVLGAIFGAFFIAVGFALTVWATRPLWIHEVSTVREFVEVPPDPDGSEFVGATSDDLRAIADDMDAADRGDCNDPAHDPELIDDHPYA